MLIIFADNYFRYSSRIMITFLPSDSGDSNLIDALSGFSGFLIAVNLGVELSSHLEIRADPVGSPIFNHFAVI